MPTEIFISYRRGDAAGHARNVYDKLVQWFEPSRVFFDHGRIRPGDDFGDVIEQEVQACRVLIALVAPDWARPEPDGRVRLNDPDDWVRREIALALSLGKAVIPVLLDDAPIPAAAALPEDLRGLFRLDVHRLRGKVEEYEAGVHTLVDLLADVEGVTPPRAAAGPAGADRRDLPLLCDRSLQNDAAAEAIRAELAAPRCRPVVLVLHGRSNEAHGAFVDRLERRSVPELLRNRPQARGLRFVALDDRLSTDGDAAAFAARLRAKIAAGLQVEEEPADDAALLALLRRERCTALVVVLDWLASEIGGDPLLPLRRVQEYWAAFPPLPPALLVGCIVCVKYDTEPGRGGLLRRWFGGTDRSSALREAVSRSATALADGRVAWCVAAELPSVTFADLHRWTLAVSRLVGRFHVPEARLRAIVGDDQARPMDDVLDELERLVVES